MGACGPFTDMRACCSKASRIMAPVCVWVQYSKFIFEVLRLPMEYIASLQK